MNRHLFRMVAGNGSPGLKELDKDADADSAVLHVSGQRKALDHCVPHETPELGRQPLLAEVKQTKRHVLINRPLDLGDRLFGVLDTFSMCHRLIMTLQRLEVGRKLL
jgi:hypothetical protein